MKSTEQAALRQLDEACKKKLECRVGSVIYRFSAYDIRQDTVYIDILDKTNQPKTIYRDINILPAFMERALAGNLTVTQDRILQISDLEPYTVKRGKVYVTKNSATVWLDKGKPNKIVFSAEYSLKIKKLNPSLKVKVFFNGENLVFVSSEQKGSRSFTNVAPGRLGIKCENFHQRVVFKKYTCDTQDIDGKLSFILTGSK